MNLHWSYRQRGGKAVAASTGGLDGRLAGHLPSSRAFPPDTQVAVAPPLGAGGAAAASVAFLRETMAAAARSATEMRRRLRRAVAATLATILSLSGVVALPAAAVVVGPGTLGGFEQDGNFVVDTPGNLDWANQPNAVVVTDDTLDSGFRGSSKEEEPGDWVCQNNPDGVDPPKDDILRAYVNPRSSGAGAYLDLAFVRKDGEGDTHINFEFSQRGEVSPYQEGACPIERTVGDLLITYDFDGTSTPTSTVRAWRWTGTGWQEAAAQSLVAMAANNTAPVNDPLAGGASVEYRGFGEITIDLNSIPGLPLACPGLGYVNVRSRSSGESFTSALQDKLPTAEVDLSTCGKITLHKVDDKGQPLAGATFALYRSDDASGQPIQQCTTDASGTCTFTEVAPGTYSVKEIAAPAGYTPDPTVAVVTVGIRQDVVIPRAFVDPLILGALTVVKTDSVNGAAVADVQFQLLQNGVVAKTRTGADAECTTGTNGECTIKDLVPGTYALHEVPATVPPTMSPVPDQTVVVVGGVTPLRVHVVNPVKPLGIGLVKLVNGQGSATVHEGDLLTYTLAVTNTGQVPIDITSLTDRANNAPVVLPAGCVALVAETAFIAPGDTVPACTYTAVAGTADITNVATVVGRDPLGRDVTDDDDAAVEVINPAIVVDKTADKAQVHPGDIVTYRVVVTNTGDTPLRLTSLSDAVNQGVPADLLATCNLTTATVLQPGQSTPVCTYRVTAGTADLLNVVVVRATDVLGGTVTDDDDAVVDVISPTVRIDKTASPSPVRAGDTITYTLVITNTGNTPLTITSLTDVANGTATALPAACTGLVSPVPLAPGATRTCSYTVVAGTADITNVATVVGTDELGRPVSDDDDAVVDVINPGIPVEVAGVSIARPPAAAAEAMARTGVDTGLQVKVALILLVLGGMALLPDHQRRRRGRFISIEQRLGGF